MTDIDHAIPGQAGQDRKRRLLWAAGTCALLCVAWAGYRVILSGRTQSTDDAYVNGHIVAITPQTAGAVSAVLADDADRILAGTPLVEIDPSDARIVLAGAEAELARAQQHVQALYAKQEQTAAQVVLSRSQLDKALADARARQGIAEQGAITAEDARHANDAVKASRAVLDAAMAADAEAKAAIAGTTAQTHPEVRMAQARLRAATLDLQRTTLRSPVSGMVAQRTVQLGKRVAIGEKLMTVVPLDRMWIDANFKEVQLDGICPGQPAHITIDAYGRKAVYHGRVQDVMAGSGSSFALLPAQNATGNWIKVVQRVPVRISLDPKELGARPLRIGLSAEVAVDTSRCDRTSHVPAAHSEITPIHREQMDAAGQVAAALKAGREQP